MEIAKIIAIDGPSGSGKSTIARKLAGELDLVYIDTGAMYRGIAYACDVDKIPLDSTLLLRNYLAKMDFNYIGEDGHLIEINGRDLTTKIRGHRISELASSLSKLPCIREYLLSKQRNIVTEKVCVMEGRDIGTVIFPNAFCKVFLTASLEVRAKRRQQQLCDLGEQKTDLKIILQDVQSRDERDSKRLLAPLKQADDAYLLDSSGKSMKEVLSDLVEHVREKGQSAGISL